MSLACSLAVDAWALRDRSRSAGAHFCYRSAEEEVMELVNEKISIFSRNNQARMPRPGAAVPAVSPTGSRG